ncbi:unnamed protein product [Brassica oleracea var. botrytis]|uniref:Uncharacterized protein n=1 Tax=Brassica oleracea TaxID=3712 RepID=A0A3P6BVU7_BRAOL|nr:unnamed protein product [Brassica oleracea]
MESLEQQLLKCITLGIPRHETQTSNSENSQTQSHTSCSSTLHLSLIIKTLILLL